MSTRERLLCMGAAIVAASLPSVTAVVGVVGGDGAPAVCRWFAAHPVSAGVVAVALAAGAVRIVAPPGPAPLLERILDFTPTPPADAARISKE